jgi:hypothetical protein
MREWCQWPTSIIWIEHRQRGRLVRQIAERAIRVPQRVTDLVGKQRTRQRHEERLDDRRLRAVAAQAAIPRRQQRERAAAAVVSRPNLQQPR